jgi:tetratricopeptide (TPR) repeat protein
MRRSITALVEQADEQEAEGLWVDAARTWASIVDAQRTTYSLLRYSSALEEAGQLADAEVAAREALRLDGRSALAFMQLGFVLKAQDRLEDARDALKQSVSIDESRPVVTVLGDVYRRLGDSAGAEAAFRRSLLLTPDDPEALYGLGMTLAPSDPNQAAELFFRILDLEPSLFDTRVQLGRVLLAAERFGEADVVLREAIALNSGDAWAHFLLGEAMESRGDLNAALERYLHAIEQDDRQTYFFTITAELFEKLGQSGRAEQFFKLGLAVDVGDSIANRRYGLFLNRSGFPARAAHYLERALRRDPKDTRARAVLDQLRLKDPTLR